MGKFRSVRHRRHTRKLWAQDWALKGTKLVYEGFDSACKARGTCFRPSSGMSREAVGYNCTVVGGRLDSRDLLDVLDVLDSGEMKYCT